jgi:outer membrane lipoprotein carrier protein
MRACRWLVLSVATLWLCGVAANATALPSATAAAPDTALDRFLNGLQNLQCEFTQETRDARGKLVESGQGRLVVQRPGRFRWEFRANGSAADGGQLMIADGKNLWFYERELAQVTVRAAAAALGATPIVLLSGTTSEIQAAFSIAKLASRDGLERVAIVPRTNAGDFSRAEIDFKGQVLTMMEINDKLGQSVRMKFSKAALNKPLSAALLTFVVPPGVDLIGTALH